MFLLDRYLLSATAVFTVFCEFVAIIYFYGPFKFTDDIFFMLGFQPGWFYVILWIIIPVTLFVSMKNMTLSNASFCYLSLFLIFTVRNWNRYLYGS